ncbi:DUF2191 domain-containing protein [Nigerium sp.]|jgi:hypothetical protein|uniref:DUF2191 domain-containing protein n=1 Tax=Nigerium sp. TaxID=2042655 RepID=UPI003221B430
MRTTLEIDDQVLAVARALAASRSVSLGAAISELARRGIEQSATAPVDLSYSPFPLLVGDAVHVITDDMVAAHRDE